MRNIISKSLLFLLFFAVITITFAGAGSIHAQTGPQAGPAPSFMPDLTCTVKVLPRQSGWVDTDTYSLSATSSPLPPINWVQVEVYNNGWSVAENFSVRALVIGDQYNDYPSFQVESLAPGESRLLDPIFIGGVYAEGGHLLQLSAAVDVNNFVTETDERNNSCPFFHF